MRILIIFISTFLFSCANEIVFEKNKSSLDEETLSNVLADLHLMEVHINQLEMNLATNKDSLNIYKEIIFSKHDIIEEDFNQSLNYYSNFPEDYHLLYLKVKEKLLDIELKIPKINSNEINTDSSMVINKKSLIKR
tara:strand:+ start:133 stop:540 length:408 start_codon:yes stop_codon:yes gene_type:complete